MQKVINWWWRRYATRLMPKSKTTKRHLSGGAAPSGSKGGFGQHFLRNPAVLTSIVDKSNIQAHDIVLEIGPGSGSLTFKLLPLCKRLIAIEIDRRMITELNRRVQAFSGGSSGAYREKFKLIHADVLKMDLPFFNVLVSNIPYQISSPLVFKLLAHRPAFRAAVIMFQDEFAQRLTAKPGDSHYSRVSVNVQLLADVQQLLKVGRNNFSPPPKVDSRVVRISPKNPAPDINFTEWDGLVRLCFNRKNKTLRAIFKSKSLIKLLEKNYKTYCSLKNKIIPEDFEFKALIEKTLQECEMSESRASKMSVDDFLVLLNAFNSNDIRFS